MILWYLRLCLNTSLHYFFPMQILITTGNYFLIVLGVFLLGFSLLFLARTMFVILILKYSSNVRYTAISFNFNTSMSIFDSTTPAVTFYLISQTKKFTCAMDISIILRHYGNNNLYIEHSS